MVTTRGTNRPAIDAESKAKTMAHMNKEHKHDLSLYLQHFAGLSATAAVDPELVDMDTQTLTIRSTNDTTIIPFTPPLESWNDRRSRLVEMSAEAEKAVALRNGVVYYAPRGLHWISFAGVTFYYICAALVFSGFVEPKSPISHTLDKSGFPYGAWGFRWIVKAIFLPVLGIHVVESFWFERTRLDPAGVRRGSVVWFLWLASTFLEGTTAFLRWDELVKGKRTHAKTH